MNLFLPRQQVPQRFHRIVYIRTYTEEKTLHTFNYYATVELSKIIGAYCCRPCKNACMPPEPDSRSLKTQLSDLRAEIQQCEAFISLCERIKHLEQLDGRETLSSKMSRLENQRTEILGQLESAILEVQQCEQRLNGAGTLQQNQLTAMIKTARGRIGSLQLAAKETTDQLEKLAREMQDNASLLPQLY